MTEYKVNEISCKRIIHNYENITKMVALFWDCRHPFDFHAYSLETCFI